MRWWKREEKRFQFREEGRESAGICGRWDARLFFQVLALSACVCKCARGKFAYEERTRARVFQVKEAAGEL